LEKFVFLCASVVKKGIVLKVLYSIGTKFGGTGIGRIAAKSLAQIAGADSVRRQDKDSTRTSKTMQGGKEKAHIASPGSGEHSLRIAAPSFEGPAPGRAAIERVKRPLRWPLTGKKQHRLKRAIAFDAAVCKMIGSDLDLFNSWNGHCLQGLKQARSLGVTTIVVRASSHMLTQMEILAWEFDRYGTNGEVELPEMIDRCVQEYDLADYVQVPSEFVRKSFLDRGFAGEKLILIPFGVDSAMFRPAGGDTIRNRVPRTFRLLFVGRIGLRKGIHYLLEAWKKLSLPNAELLLIGNVEPGFEKILRQYRNLPGLTIPGFVKDPVKLFASSSVFVFPSLEEGSAMVTYEAMASGLPLVTTFNSGSLARDGVDGYIIPIRDVDAICEKVEKLYRDRDLARQMGHSGRELISEYTWERHSRELAEHYGKIEEIRRRSRRL
jgi:glycosyltransferase involved in cell wall biosynthesis